MPSSGPDHLRANVHEQDSMKLNKVPGAIAAMLLMTGMANGETTANPAQLTEVYGAWTVRCQAETGEGKAAGRQCELFQERLKSDTQQLVASLSYRQLPDGGALVVVLAPFGLRLSEGVRYVGGDTDLWSSGFQTCLPSGCIAVPQLSKDDMNAVLGAKTAKLVFVSNNGNRLNVEVDTSGFGDAWQRLAELVAGN